MVAPQGMVLITIPANLPIEDGLVDQGKLYTITFCSQLLETRLLRILRFQFGEVSQSYLISLNFASWGRFHRALQSQSIFEPHRQRQ